MAVCFLYKIFFLILAFYRYTTVSTSLVAKGLYYFVLPSVSRLILTYWERKFKVLVKFFIHFFFQKYFKEAPIFTGTPVRPRILRTNIY